MSINTLGYNTSIALGALFGGWFADRLGVDSAVWFGTTLTCAALLVSVGIGRRISLAAPAERGRPAGDPEAASKPAYARHARRQVSWTTS